MSFSPGAAALRIVRAPDPATAAEPPSTAELLCLGGDGRIHLDTAGRANRYGCAPRPDDALVAFGSSTASTVSCEAFAAADRLRSRLVQALEHAPSEAVYARETARIRAELLGLHGLEGQGVEVVLAPSGTDLHLFAGQLIAAGSATPLAIIPEESETGSGVPAALAGRSLPAPSHSGGASAAAALAALDVRSVAARGPDGAPRLRAAVDADVEALAEAAAREGRPVLLVLIDVSKTGLVSPSPRCALALAERFGGQVTVLVDACQLRLTAQTLQAYLDGGAMVALTGSKFLTGPAFSAALLIPRALAATMSTRSLPPALQAVSARADWPSGWVAGRGMQPGANLGLLVRWEAALEELRRFADVSDGQAQAFAAGFGCGVRQAFDAHPELDPLETGPVERDFGGGLGWDRLRTIFPFLLRRASGGWLSRAETLQVYRLMRRDLGAVAPSRPSTARAAASSRIELGQPIAVGRRDGVAVHALRICLSSRLIHQATGGDPRAAARILEDVRLALAKAAWLAREVGAGRL